MTSAEAIAHLKKRMLQLKDIYVDQFPRWTNTDYVAVSILLSALEQQDQLREARLRALVNDALVEIEWQNRQACATQKGET